jgi:hypothetical protein
MSSYLIIITLFVSVLVVIALYYAINILTFFIKKLLEYFKQKAIEKEIFKKSEIEVIERKIVDYKTYILKIKHKNNEYLIFMGPQNQFKLD